MKMIKVVVIIFVCMLILGLSVCFFNYVMYINDGWIIVIDGKL